MLEISSTKILLVSINLNLPTLRARSDDCRYCVNSAVFLYKAWSFDVLSAQEKKGIRHMINDVIRQLQKASVRPNDFSSRYSELLDRLWQRKDSESQAQSRAKTPNPIPRHSNISANIGPPDSNIDSNLSTQNHNNVNFLAPSTPYRSAATPVANNTWQNGFQDEFSWLDLQAVGELVTGTGAGDMSGLTWNTGGGMMDIGGFGYGGFGAGDGWGGDWGVGEDDVGRFF